MIMNNWAVELTPSNIEFFKKFTKENWSGAYGYIHSNKVSTNVWSSYVCTGYKEISFEEFERFVLNKERSYELW